jgi:hypothetical protein
MEDYLYNWRETLGTLAKKPLAPAQAQARRALDALERQLKTGAQAGARAGAKAGAKAGVKSGAKSGASTAGPPVFGVGGVSMPFARSDLARAQGLYLDLWNLAGQGKQSLEEGLLSGIAMACDASTVPFWVQVMGLSKASDRFGAGRRELACAALGLLASDGGSAEAMGALEAAAGVAATQEAAVMSLADAFAEGDEPLPERVAQVFERVATEARAFEPRYLARLALSSTGIEPPLDAPDGTFCFEVTSGERSRTIELRSTDVLYSLHGAILEAFGWDDEHLFAFYLDGRLFDEGPFIWPLDDDDEAGEDDAPAQIEQVGRFGFVEGQELAYVHDFGEDHRCALRVARITPTADARGQFPRVTASKGKTPPARR